MVFTVVLLGLAVAIQATYGSIYDCWDPEKLKRMKVAVSDNPSDPGLSQFAMMVKCLSMQQGHGSNLENQWQQWSNVDGGQFIPSWQDPYRPRQNDRQPDWTSSRGVTRSPSVPDGGRNIGPPKPYQPKPGVHPDDWSQRVSSTTPGLRNPLEGRNHQKPIYGREKEEHPEGRVNLSPFDKIGSVTTEKNWDQGVWKKPNKMDVPNTLVRPEDEAVTLSRKYSFAILALSVIALAIIVLFTLFCCNPPSRFNQDANMNFPINQFDTQSMYSNRLGPGTTGTMRSMGTIGGISNYTTETLKSRGGSPQLYRSELRL